MVSRHQPRTSISQHPTPQSNNNKSTTKTSKQITCSNTIQQRGLVPTLTYNSQTITESGVVAQFLADAHPSHLSPTTGTPEAALKRARTNFFVDAWFSKVNSFSHQIALLADQKEREERGRALVAAVEKEIEPLLEVEGGGAGPYFGGSDKIGLAEVRISPFAFLYHFYCFWWLFDRCGAVGRKRHILRPQAN